MSPTEQENVITMLDMHVNKNLLQDQLMKETGKVVLLKDVHNLSTFHKPSNDAQTLLEHFMFYFHLRHHKKWIFTH